MPPCACRHRRGMAVGDSAWLVVGGSVTLRAGKRGAWSRVGAAVSTGRCLAGMLRLVVVGGGWWLEAASPCVQARGGACLGGGLQCQQADGLQASCI